MDNIRIRNGLRTDVWSDMTKDLKKLVSFSLEMERLSSCGDGIWAARDIIGEELRYIFRTKK